LRSIAIIGAGAAGCFAAASLAGSIAITGSSGTVCIYEAGPKPLAKLAVTGGGRCNLTNTFQNIRSIEEAYPRGFRLMKRALKEFSPEDTLQWFAKAGVKGFSPEPDGCVFPSSQDAMEIVNRLLGAIGGASIHTGKKLLSLSPQGNGWLLGFADGSSSKADIVLVTSGGAPNGLPFIDGLDIPWVRCVPSLFTFTINDPGLRSLMGLVVPVRLSIPGGFRSEGPLLITDWGLSGPAVLKISSYAARRLHESGYKEALAINWASCSQADAELEVKGILAANPQKLLSSAVAFALPQRLWKHILQRAGIREDMRCGELGSKGFSRLVATLCSDQYRIEGRSHFREEFVTAGGVDLQAVNPATMECRNHPGLYFAGEVLDVDAITGGFNLQAAWSTAWLAARAISKTLDQ